MFTLCLLAQNRVSISLIHIRIIRPLNKSVLTLALAVFSFYHFVKPGKKTQLYSSVNGPDGPVKRLTIGILC